MDIESDSRHTPLHLTTENPKGWLKASLSQHKANLEAAKREGHEGCGDFLIEDQRRRWTETTGLTPENSRFTLIVPIHNEERFLPSFLSSLMLADIPRNAKVNIVLVTNACSDSSVKIVQDFMRSLGEVENFRLPGNLSDRAIYSDASTVLVQNTRFTHTNTPTPGKANALTVGNELALSAGHNITMSIDANNFIEPDGVRKMFAKALEVMPERQTILLWGKSFQARRLSKYTRFLNLPLEIPPSEKKGIVAVGWFMAWDANWLGGLGGFPAVANEDYAIGAIAKKRGKTIEEVGGVHVWGYTPNNPADMLEGYARAIRAKMQLLDLHPDLLHLIREEKSYMRSWPERAKACLASVITNPKRASFRIAEYLLWEIAHIKAAADYEKDPVNQSWNPILSTK